MIEEGKIDYNAPAENYLPELGNMKILTGFEDGIPQFRDPTSKATVKQLLSHTSGTASLYGNTSLIKYIEALKKMDPEMVKKYPTVNEILVEDPGKKFIYGKGTDLLGYIAEEIIDKPLDDILEERLFKPIGMEQTKRIVAPEDEAVRAKVHGPSSQGLPVIGFMQISQKEGKRELPGAGGLSSTMNSYSLLLATLLNGGVSPKTGNRILKESTIDKYLFTPQLDPHQQYEMFPAAAPEYNLSPDLMPGTPKNFSAGFLLNLEDVPNGRKAFSGGWAGLANTYYFIDRKSGVALLITTQILPFGDPEVIKMLENFELAVYKSL